MSGAKYFDGELWCDKHDDGSVYIYMLMNMNGEEFKVRLGINEKFEVDVQFGEEETSEEVPFGETAYFRLIK